MNRPRRFPRHSFVEHIERLTTGKTSLPQKSLEVNGKDAEKGDGITGFHWLSAEDSESMTIRYQEEPVPAP